MARFNEKAYYSSISLGREITGTVKLTRPIIKYEKKFHDPEIPGCTEWHDDLDGHDDNNDNDYDDEE